jgi:hypothetical protein
MHFLDGTQRIHAKNVTPQLHHPCPTLSMPESLLPKKPRGDEIDSLKTQRLSPIAPVPFSFGGFSQYLFREE